MKKYLSILLLFFTSVAIAGYDAGSADQVMVVPHAGGKAKFGQVDLSQAAAVKNSVGITNGGTGQTSKAPAFDALQPMTTGGDLIYGGASGTGTRLPNGSNGQVLTSSGGTSAPTWTNLVTVLTKTTTYSAAITDGLILCSGSAFTVTLPTAVGNTGSIMRIKKTDSSLTNIITIATTSAQTIDGASTYTLNTQYEQLVVASDGANWAIIDHTYPMTSTAYTPNYSAGFGTVTNNLMEEHRVGDGVVIQGVFTVGTTAASAATMSLPSGMTCDSNKLLASGTSYTVVGSYEAGFGSAAVKHGTVLCASGATVLSFSYDDTSGSVNPLVPQNGNIISGSSAFKMSVNVWVPIAGWN